MGTGLESSGEVRRGFESVAEWGVLAISRGARATLVAATTRTGGAPSPAPAFYGCAGHARSGSEDRGTPPGAGLLLPDHFSQQRQIGQDQARTNDHGGQGFSAHQHRQPVSSRSGCRSCAQRAAADRRSRGRRCLRTAPAECARGSRARPGQSGRNGSASAFPACVSVMGHRRGTPFGLRSVLDLHRQRHFELRRRADFELDLLGGASPMCRSSAFRRYG